MNPIAATQHRRRRPTPPRRGERLRVGLALAALVATGLALSACGTVEAAAPSCPDAMRLALVAQSVPTASYLPCLHRLPDGWQVTQVDIASGHTILALLSDRAEGRAVVVTLLPSCDAASATAEAPRADGIRTSVYLNSISDRYAGTMYDVFPGGCITYRFDFARGPHIALMEELNDTAGLLARRELRLDLRRQFGVELDP